MAVPSANKMVVSPTDKKQDEDSIEIYFCWIFEGWFQRRKVVPSTKKMVVSPTDDEDEEDS